MSFLLQKQITGYSEQIRNNSLIINEMSFIPQDQEHLLNSIFTPGNVSGKIVKIVS
jgi:hypothetical protein